MSDRERMILHYLACRREFVRLISFDQSKQEFYVDYKEMSDAEHIADELLRKRTPTHAKGSDE